MKVQTSSAGGEHKKEQDVLVGRVRRERGRKREDD